MVFTKNKKNKNKKKVHHNINMLFFIWFFAIFLSIGIFFLVPVWMPVVYEANTPIIEKIKNDEATTSLIVASTTIKKKQEKDIQKYNFVTHIKTPKAVKAIYMTQCVVGTPSFRKDLVDLIEETELNSVIIDIKDYTGKISFNTQNPVLAESVSSQCGATDMKEFIKTLHDKNIYVLGRITVFQDPYYSLKHPELAVKFATPEGTVWKDHKGLSFIDVGAKPFWDYIVTISSEAYKLGFDELNYDYVRFPSDGPMKNIHFDWAGNEKKQVVIEKFFSYLNKKIKDKSKYLMGVNPPVMSADLFGMVTTNYDDLNIGQVLERAMPYFDYIDPMVYPSHYPKGFNGWTNPNNVPYDLIKFVLDSAVKRAEAKSSQIEIFNSEPIYKTMIVPPTSSTTATTSKKVFTGMYTKEIYNKNKIRPWLQDFDYGGDYDIPEVKAQIQATYDAGLNSWMLWAPSNRYTKGALKNVAVSTSTEQNNN